MNEIQAFELGAAWARCENSAPEGWAIRSLIRQGSVWELVAAHGRSIVVHRGNTPTDALRHLADEWERVSGEPR